MIVKIHYIIAGEEGLMLTTLWDGFCVDLHFAGNGVALGICQC